MRHDIVEEGQPMGDAAATIEKKARQLVYDSRYEVKRMLAGKKVDAVAQERMVLQRIGKSTAIPAVKARARQMLTKKAGPVKEDYISQIQETATDNVANALFKVFVEGVQKPEVQNDYLEELASAGDKKYKIRVTDPKTGNSYVRYATREKITQLRAQGLKVELTEYGEPREGERKKGEDTAQAKKSRKLDPVGKEDGDVDNDGDKDKSDAYLMKRRKAIGSAIDKRKTVSASYEMDGEMIDESQIGDRVRRVVGDQRQGVHGDADAMKQDMDATRDNLLKLRPYGVKGFPSVNKEIKPSAQVAQQKKEILKPLVAHFEPEGQLVDEAKKKKKKKTTEPRWQDSDGDGKWYEPGEDVRKEDYLWTEAKKSKKGSKAPAEESTGVDNYASGAVKMFPNDSEKKSGVMNAGFEMSGPILSEKAMSKAQQRFMGMVYAAKKGEKPASPEVAQAAAGMSKKEAKKFAKTKHKGLPEKKGKKKSKMSEAVESQTQNRDTRGDYAFRNVLKNKLRSAMGVKNPMVLMDPEKLEKDFGKVATADNIKTACEEMTTSHEFKTGTTKPPAAPTLPALTKKPSNVQIDQF